MILTKHGLTRCSTTRHKPSYRGWMRQPRRRKRALRAGKRVRDSPTPTVRSGTKTPGQTTTVCVQRPTTELCRLCDCPWITCFVGSVGYGEHCSYSVCLLLDCLMFTYLCVTILCMVWAPMTKLRSWGLAVCTFMHQVFFWGVGATFFCFLLHLFSIGCLHKYQKTLPLTKLKHLNSIHVVYFF